jgi:peptide deformylase
MGIMVATKSSIITLPNAHLRERSTKIRPSEELATLVEDMVGATLDWEDSRPHELGVALAAVQIDRLSRVIVVRNNFDDKDDRSFFTLVNPEVIKVEGSPVYDHEGCLSVRDIYGLVPRYPKVRIKAQDLEGNEIRLKAEGFLARVLQHEIDHTNGILFIDHIKQNDAFFQLDEDGKLVKLKHEDILASDILWD